MKKGKVVLLLILIGFVAVLGVKKLYLTSSVQKSPNIPSESSKPVQLELEYPYETLNVADSERRDITGFVKQFETLQYKRKPDEILALFSIPKDSQEIDTYNFLVGKDINNSVRLYRIAGFNCSLNWFMIRKISKQDSKITVELRELRTAYLNDIADYKAVTKDLIMEVSKSSDGSYQIERYYYKGDGVTSELKYGGFDCTL